MSELAPSGRQDALSRWRRNRAEKERMVATRTDSMLVLWSALLLAATVLYVMIGHSPYNHELVFDPLTGGAIASPVNRFVWLVLLALSAPALIVRADAAAKVLASAWPLLALMLWFGATTVWALDPDASRKRFFVLVITMIVCVAIRTGMSNVRQTHTVLAWTCLILIVVDLGSWILAPRLSMTELGLAAIHNHKNTLGAAMLFSGLVIVPYIFTRKTMAGRIGWTAAFVGAIALLIASRSKTSLGLAAAAAAAAPVVLGVVGLRTRLVLGIAALAAASVLALVLGWLAYCAVDGLDAFAPLTQLSFTRRTDVWRFVWGEWLKRPWGGAGFASFWDVNPVVQPSLQTDEWFAKPTAPTNEAHNGFLDLLATTGAPGLLGALGLLGRWSFLGLSRARDARMGDGLLGREGLAYAAVAALFPLIFFAHNWMESSLFNPEATYNFLIIFFGVGLEADTSGVRALSARSRLRSDA